MKKYLIKYRTSKKEYKEVLVTALDKDSAVDVIMRPTNNDLGDSVIESVERVYGSDFEFNGKYVSK